jgi:phenylacetate-CoA ligase
MLIRLADSIAGKLSPGTLADLYQRVPEGILRRVRQQRFRQTVRWAAQHSAFYRNAFRQHGIDADRVRVPSDLGNFYTTPDDVIANPESFICRPPSIVFESSGTSGKNKQIYYDHAELQAMAQVDAAGLRLMGLTPQDRVANAFDFCMWIPGMITHNSLMAAGNFSMAFGKVDPVEVYRRLKQYRFSVVMGEPTWLIRLTELAEKHGSVPLKLFIGGAEEMPAEAIPWMRQVWQGVKVKMCYGSVELGSALGYQPCDAFNGYHTDDLSFTCEIIEPDAEGFGEMVFTTLLRRVMPLIRYRTRDVTKIMTKACACGKRGLCISRFRGRRDEMIVASGGNLYPLMFSNILEHVPGLSGDWQVLFKLENIREIMEIHLESARTDHDEIRRQVHSSAAQEYPDLMKNLAIGIFDMRIVIHQDGELRVQRKLKRLIDLRYPTAAKGVAATDNGQAVGEESVIHA